MYSTHCIHTHTTCSTSEIYPESSIPKHSHLSVRKLYTCYFSKVYLRTAVFWYFQLHRVLFQKIAGVIPRMVYSLDHTWVCLAEALLLGIEGMSDKRFRTSGMW